jgi:hypothetical protein
LYYVAQRCLVYIILRLFILLTLCQLGV